MKNYFFRCTAIFILILSLGVGHSWANTTHPVYCAIRPSSLGETGELYLNVHKGTTFDGGDWYQVKMDKIATTIHKAATGETKDLYVASIEYVEVGLQQMEFQIYDAAPPASLRETHVAFNSWTTNSDIWTKQVFDYENGNFTTYPASLTQKKSYVYFDAADWNDNVKQLVISHGTYRGFNNLNYLSNTTLYYANPELNWGDAVCISFIGNSTSWSETGKWLNDIPIWSHHYTGYLHYSLQENSFNYFARRSGDKNGAALSYNYWGTENTAYQNLNKTQTVQARVKTTGSSYSDVSFASWPGSVSAERTYMSSATATSSPTANMTSATTDAVLTSSITLTASANSGYYFEGWGDASDSNPTDGTTAKTYSVTDTKTSYAFFSQTYTLTYDRKGNYSTSTLSVYSVDNFSGSTSSGSSIPTGHLITLVATPATGYEVEGWYSDASCETAYTSGSGGITIDGGGNTFKLASLNANIEVYCKFQPKTYTINLVGMEATTSGTTRVDVTYNASTNMTASDPITKPTKTNYDFGGYWVRNEDTKALVTKLIDEDGKWIKDKEGYTSHDGSDNPTWVHDFAISLYAKWTETAYTITATANPAEGGSVNSVTDAHWTMPSSAITATPTNAAWVFSSWGYGTHVGCASGCSTNSVTVTSDMNSTITANFTHRYNLLGSKYEEGKGKAEMATGGMPGWTYGSGADFTINSYTADGDNATVDLSYTCMLEAGTYIFEIHDRGVGESLGRKGDGGGIYQLTDGNSVELRGGEDHDQSIFFYPQHAGQYTFRITYMTKNGNYYYPTVTIERPHQLHMGHVHAEIDNTSATTSGDTGGTLSATIGESPISNDGWYSYGTDIAYTASPATGYTAKWYTDNTYSSEFPEQPENSWTDHNVTHDENVYVRFTEKATTVTLSNDEHGKVQINSTDKTSTTCGVTTTRELTAVPNDGYMFSSWTKTSGDDITISSTSTNPTTLRGQGAGATSGQTVTANFTYRWALKAESAGWGESEFIIENITTDGSGDVVGYVEITLAANTNYQFKMKDLLTNDIYKNNNTAVQYMTYTNHTDWGFATDYTFNCGITTAGKGTYRFTWNVTDKTMTVTYPTSYQVNYGASVGGSVTSVKDDDNNDVPNGGYVRSGGRVTYTAAANAYYTFVGWCNNETYGAPFNTELSWTNSNVTETQNSFAKFKSTNFVIYRSGDMAEDDRAALDDVESYAGGTISEAIEFRMKVHTLDQWYTLCLPFTVNAVMVWDPDDGPEYYDIVPYYRTGGTFYNGHYIIRTPSPAVGYAIETFETNWQDPANSSVLPSKNVPYIIQWHDNYFLNKYISFFGASGQTIPGSMTEGAAPSDNTLVNVYGNDAMTIGSVKGAYMFESDYGAGGAWLRDEDPDADRLVLPFDCYIRATESITRKYRVIRRGMTIEDTATGWQDVLNSENKVHIAVYTLSGILIAQYDNCSFTEVANRLRSQQHTGLFILRTVNESVKLMIGGK